MRARAYQCHPALATLGESGDARSGPSSPELLYRIVSNSEIASLLDRPLELPRTYTRPLGATSMLVGLMSIGPETRAPSGLFSYVRSNPTISPQGTAGSTGDRTPLGGKRKPRSR